MPRAVPAVLYRYPGPCGLNEHLGPGLGTLGPPGSRALWLAGAAWHEDVAGTRHFGTLALLDPLLARPAETGRPGIYVGRNEPERRLGRYLWIPPSWVARPDLTERLLHGDIPRPGDEVRHVEAALHAYLEEIGMLRIAGGEAPRRPWCTIPLGERRRRLRQVGVEPLWTGVLDEAVHVPGAA
jgi:hypothetical protein